MSEKHPRPEPTSSTPIIDLEAVEEWARMVKQMRVILPLMLALGLFATYAKSMGWVK